MLGKVLGDRRGSISIIAALSFVAVIGVAALAVEYGRALMQRTENQRTADLAAYAGALVYNATASTGDATGAAANIVSLNGSSNPSASIVSSPTGDGNQAMQVDVTADVPLHLARVLTSSTTLPVSAAASAEIKANAAGCIIALSPLGTGVTVTNAASITADNCAVASNAAVTAASASTITTKVVDYGVNYAATGASKFVTPSGGTPTFNPTGASDPLNGNSAVAAATAHLGFDTLGNCVGIAGTICAITSPSAPSGVTGGTDLTLNLLSKTGSLPVDCSTSSTKSPWAITCSGTGPIQFGSLTIGGSTTATFTSTSSGATYTFSGLISATSSAGLTFNGGSNATYKMAAGIAVDGASTASFGAGAFQIGAGTGTCNGAASGYSICNGDSGSGTLTFAGPGTFMLAGGIYNGSSSHLTMGSGSSSNSYDIGSASDGYSIYANITGVTLGDATGPGDVFETAGSISTAGSSTLTIPAAAEHDIRGNVLVASSSTANFGAGVYTVTGYVSVGGSSGAATLTGSANGVTLVVGGASTPSSGACSGMAFCAAQASKITLVAPSSGTTEDLAVIGPTSSSITGGALISAAGSSSLSGAVYFPNGPVTVSSASGLGGGAGQCLQVIGSQVTVSGASAIGTTCAGLGGGAAGAGGTVALVK